MTGMTETQARESSPQRRRVRPGAVVLLVLATALAPLVVTISYGLALEYGDTAAPEARIAAQSFRDWGIGVALVTGLAGWVVVAARRSRGRRVMRVSAAVVAVATLVGVPGGAVLGVHQKLDAYPDLPSCTDGFRTGPAVPVVRAAQAGFAELDHPGPFSGGGSSGVDGCSNQLMVDEDVDVPARYRGTLTDNGWRTTRATPDLLEATKNGQDFEASQDRDGSWWVWIGPAGLRSQPADPGEVTPRR
jgi:hypothetical protein